MAGLLTFGGEFPFFMMASQSPNKQLQRTVIPNRWRAARAPFHYARASRWTGQRAAAQLRR
jgi:hypothetical protein